MHKVGRKNHEEDLLRESPWDLIQLMVIRTLIKTGIRLLNLKRKNKIWTKNSIGTLTKPELVKPRSVSPKSSSGSSSSHRRIPKQSKTKNFFSKLPVDVSKPNYKWVPQNLSVKSPQSPLNASDNLSVLKCEKVNSVDRKGKPNFSMVSVPKSN